MTTYQEVLDFWFGPSDDPFERAETWWTVDPEFDAEIEQRFEADLERAAAGELDDWKTTPRGRLGWVILLDQFSRNIYRETTEMYAHDELALEAALDGIRQGDDEPLEPIERQFLYMPLMHAESRSIQEKSVQLFEQLRDEAPADQRENFENAYEFAVRHAEIVEEFGRFPHRNEILNRESTADERDFLEEHGRGF